MGLLADFFMGTPDGRKLKATASTGISPNHGSNPNDLFLVADNYNIQGQKVGQARDRDSRRR
uniref:GGDEF:EAL n=1 Tax=mine drainage metagenome TaxID=410659 RepID=E6QR45_9ZZZZ